MENVCRTAIAMRSAPSTGQIGANNTKTTFIEPPTHASCVEKQCVSNGS